MFENLGLKECHEHQWCSASNGILGRQTGRFTQFFLFFSCIAETERSCRDCDHCGDSTHGWGQSCGLDQHSPMASVASRPSSLSTSVTSAGVASTRTGHKLNSDVDVVSRNGKEGP
ncbi:hypothetical protein ILYODFUR_021314 [Ilyodon furcidens]|uniref:Uncharacterized protein n=1 Tax=Ilyodon furcidens TaxID=33524 RepID=A0ABV0V4W6_9TELE